MRCLGLCVAMLLASSACSGQGNRQEKRTPPAASGLSETELNSLAEKAPYSSVVAPRGSGGLGIDGYWHGKFFLKALTLAGKSTFAEKLFRSPGSDQFYRQLAGPDLARGLITVGQVNAAATILKEAETDAARNDYLSGLGEVGLLWAEASRPDDLSRIVEFCRAFASSRKLYPAHLDQMGAVAGALVNSGRLQEAEAFVDFLRGKGDLSSVRYSVLTPYGRALASAGPSEKSARRCEGIG